MTATTNAPPEESGGTRARLVEPHLLVPFILVVACFAAWGIAANLTDILVGVFRSIFDMSNLQSSLVQSAYYGAYFLLAVPAAFINSRFGYKAGMLTGLGLAAAGGILFFPASQMLVYEAFLVALFVLAAGLSILETSANPLVIAMGDEATATRRLNLAQAFNPVGANIGVLLGAVLILPGLTSEAAKTIMTAEELRASQETDLLLVLRPYLGIAAVLVILWLALAFRKIPELPAEQQAEARLDRSASGGVAGRLWRNRRYRYGVIAQFFNVAAQTCVWTFTVIYALDVVGVSSGQSGMYLQASLIVFLVARFAMVYLLGIFRPAKLLLIMATFGVICCLMAMFVLNIVGLIAVVAISAGLSLMFPTIYGLALEGLGEDAKFGAAGLVMAILGGAILPLVQGAVMDSVGSTAFGYVVPAACLAFVAGYAVFELRTRPVLPGVPAETEEVSG
ncbi:L-fucose:H+ symporter permease [Ornithinicoccus hortensis]|uniref:FHS family L-fucose permease-like MFS transporter n=1 Tax=Ornithinicoccus hortensis TaxID=82346 RepID=A0A542YM22_9MICO|nr:L-fucose:H+ symporter permease [Ornithinicoccus hortensis]TQL49014.1 FHS family L-fucose permease-like MFS transporter [Ornithinicoccus hortensis]